MAELLEIDLYISSANAFDEQKIDFYEHDEDEGYQNIACTKPPEIERIEISPDTEFEIYHTYEKGVLFCNGENFTLINFNDDGKKSQKDFVVNFLPGYYYFHEDGITIEKIRAY